jgi:endothelin-converting enzyme/putative endopeptidase
MKLIRAVVTFIAFAACAFAQSAPKQPLHELPYTPSLDVKAMDKSVDPCTDFYQYSCGGWRKANPIPADQASWSVYGKLTDENQQYLWGILDELSKPGAKRDAVQQKIGDYFGACMDTKTVEAAGATPLKPGLAQIAAMKSVADITPFLAKEHLSMQGSGLMFGFGSNQDFGDAAQVIAFAEAGGLGLPDRDYYTKQDKKSVEIRERYVQHIAKMLELIGEDSKKAAEDAATVMRMETALAKASLTRVDRRDPYKLFHRMSPAEFQQLAPSIDWQKYMAGQGLKDIKIVNVTEPEFFKALDAQLKAESLDNWKTYLRWHFVAAKAAYLSSAFENERFAFYSKYLRGVSEMPPRWKRCVRYVDRDLGEALGQEFVRRNFSPEMKSKTLQMTELIEKAMEQEINQLDWMGPQTKQKALEKLHSVRNKVGYPDKWRDYSSINVKGADFFGNVERATVFESNRQLAKIGQPVDKAEWGMTPPTVNAYYNPQMNDINFPAGVLQPPLYDAKIDDAPNYGNTGATIGHELTHAFDDEGRQFDAAGNLKDWWTKEDAEAFENKINCVRDQYKEYTIVDDIKINSKLTSGEDVADIGGTLLAYIAWKEATKTLDLKPMEGFTPDQRFFIGMAQWACENERDENLRVSAITNPHSPGKYRINGVVINLPQFQQAFGCKAGQPMYKASDKVCKVW